MDANELDVSAARDATQFAAQELSVAQADERSARQTLTAADDRIGLGRAFGREPETVAGTGDHTASAGDVGVGLRDPLPVGRFLRRPRCRLPPELKPMVKSVDLRTSTDHDLTRRCCRRTAAMLPPTSHSPLLIVIFPSILTPSSHLTLPLFCQYTPRSPHIVRVIQITITLCGVVRSAHQPHGLRPNQAHASQPMVCG